MSERRSPGADATPSLDTREVVGKGKRKRGSRGRRTAPSDYRREIGRLEVRIEAAKGSTEVETLYADLRTARAALAAKLGDEGDPFERPCGVTDSGDVIVARSSRKREGEVLPVVQESRHGT